MAFDRVQSWRDRIDARREPERVVRRVLLRHAEAVNAAHPGVAESDYAEFELLVRQSIAAEVEEGRANDRLFAPDWGALIAAITELLVKLLPLILPLILDRSTSVNEEATPSFVG